MPAVVNRSSARFVDAAGAIPARRPPSEDDREGVGDRVGATVGMGGGRPTDTEAAHLIDFIAMLLRHLPLRLLVAFVTSLSMLHLGLEGSGVVCSSDQAGGVPRTMAMRDAGSHAGHGAPAAAAPERSDTAQHEKSAHAPAQERCCESMSSCGVTTVASVAAGASAQWPAGRPSADSDSMLASVATAPEPPPPKA